MTRKLSLFSYYFKMNNYNASKYNHLKQNILFQFAIKTKIIMLVEEIGRRCLPTKSKAYQFDFMMKISW